MAKATAHCKCKKCGEDFIRENTNCFKRSQADDWEKWAENYYDLCDRCYHKEQDELEKQKGLYVDVRLGGMSGLSITESPIAFVFGGDTYPYKDKIKALGAFWTKDYPSKGVLGDIFDFGSSPFRWVIWSELDDMESKIEEIKKIGARINSFPSNTDIALFLSIYNTIIKRRKEQEREIEALGKCPAWPKDIDDLWPDGTKWNGRFYGHPGDWYVYFSGTCTELTNEQKEVMEETLKKRREWREKKKEIETKYQ